MALNIETFSNAKGGNAFFKAIGHPLAARKVPSLLDELRGQRVALYDPMGFGRAFCQIYDLSGLSLVGYFVQDLGDLGRELLGHKAQPVTDLASCDPSAVVVMAFDAHRLIDNMSHLIPASAKDRLFTLDALRLPKDMLADQRRYLQGLNFATNLVFFREQDGHHTRLVTADYWSTYGAKDAEVWCCLMDQQGQTMAEWRDPLPGAGKSLIIDSAEVRERFNLSPFTGQLFLHILKAAGHDIVKYALDTYGDDDDTLSCTHDANSWPADLYAGLPAPQEGEEVILWVQNSHPAKVPAGQIGLNLMGQKDVAWLEREIPPFGLCDLRVSELLPEARWPQQVEVQAGKYFVRPRYEVVSKDGRRRIAHANVERTDLKADPQIPELSNLLGKGFILPAPILPRERFRSIALPTPMATCQESLPTALRAYDAQGREIGGRVMGNLDREQSVMVEAADLLNGSDALSAPDSWGHMELIYDFSDGGTADGWLHALFRYEDLHSGHAAETSFGAHMFNALLTYKGEPQSYAGPAPGLSTRLFLSFGPAPCEPLCHLIYPASTPWHEFSATRLILYNGEAEEIASEEVRIACGGSLLWRPHEVFGRQKMAQAGERGYAIIRDTTCRLFGYHGLTKKDRSFSFDHMFGF
ncbi:MAG: hypothetical protein AAF530_06055 [Pseudomonadota bacterium]